MLDVKRLRVLREVAARGSFSAAAEALAYTQSAVSQQVAALERETGVRLLQRTPRGVTPTAAGEALVRHADAVICRLAEAEAELEAIAGLRGGRVHLAAFPSASAMLVPTAISLFSARHPAVDVELSLAEPLDGLAMLHTGECDVALTTGNASPPDERLELTHLLEDPVCAVVPLAHPLAGRSAVRLEWLRDEPFMFGRDGACPDRAVLVGACRRAGFEPRVTVETDDYNAMQGFVAVGMGVALIPELALVNVREDVVARPLAGEVTVRQIYAATTPGAARSPATAALVEALRDAAGSVAEPADLAV